jgi:hypothetical protein
LGIWGYAVQWGLKSGGLGVQEFRGLGFLGSAFGFMGFGRRVKGVKIQGGFWVQSCQLFRAGVGLSVQG